MENTNDSLAQQMASYEQLYLYRSLLARRDELKKEICNLQETLFLSMGDLQIELFQKQIEVIRLKKEISWIHQKLNIGSVPDPEDMEEEINRIMEGHYEKLQNLLTHYHTLQEARTLTPEEARILKKQYRTIIRLLHPDLHPEFKERDDLLQIWMEVRTAYRRSDIEAMEALFVQVQQLLGTEKENLYIPENLDEKIEKVQEEIEELQRDHIFQLQFWLEDSSAIEVARENLKEQIEQYDAYLQALQKEKKSLLEKSTWQIH